MPERIGIILKRVVREIKERCVDKRRRAEPGKDK